MTPHPETGHATAEPARKRPRAVERPDPARPEDLPGIGRFGARWWTAVALLAATVGAGLYAYALQLVHGEGVTGMRTIGAGGATWGLYIVFVVFFIGAGFAGITLAAVIRVFRLSKLRPFSRMAELLTLVSLMMGGLCVVADLGRPLAGLLDLPRYARTASPFFGTFSLIMGGSLFATLVYFYLAGRADAAWCAARAPRFRGLYRLLAGGYGGTPAERERRRRGGFWLGVTILPLLLAGFSAEGFIFGIQGGRPGWFNALQGPGFVVMAGISGVGLLIGMAAAARRFLRLETTLRADGFRWLGNVLLVLTLVYLYFMIAEEVTAGYAAYAGETRIAHEIVFGAYAGIFWAVVGCLVAAAGILFVQFTREGASIPWTVAAAVLANVAAVLKRFLIVVPSQTHGMLLPYENGAYAPNTVELGVVAGILAAGTLAVLLFVKFFPIVPVEPAAAGPGPETAERRPGGLLRTALVLATLAAGAVLAVVGFLASARVGVESFMDPAIPYAPVLFIAGIVTCLASAAIYELVPDPSRDYEPEGVSL